MLNASEQHAATLQAAGDEQYHQSNNYSLAIKCENDKMVAAHSICESHLASGCGLVVQMSKTNETKPHRIAQLKVWARHIM